jgi:hypothetical protein
MRSEQRPRVVLVCHEGDRIDNEIIAAWLCRSFTLVGIVVLRETPFAVVRRTRREIRRVGLLRFIDVAAFRLYYSLWLAKRDAAWIDAEVARLGANYPLAAGIPRLIASSPNTAQVREFLRQLAPDLILARCKSILKPEIFTIPRGGTWVLHPGICPEYRNAHGCFWALAKRDLRRVGMTLLQVDRGVDTGPVYLQASYAFDERVESHVVIQYRAVLENLPAIEATLLSAWNGTARPMPTEGRGSATWGQPWLSEYFRWRRAAREATV